VCGGGSKERPTCALKEGREGGTVFFFRAGARGAPQLRIGSFLHFVHSSECSHESFMVKLEGKSVTLSFQVGWLYKIHAHTRKMAMHCQMRNRSHNVSA
jgi:hypothetical protein